MREGSCGYVLPKYNNTSYIRITDGCDFGTEDIVGCIMKYHLEDEEDWISQKDKLIRQFTVVGENTSTLLTLSIHDLNKMQLEFVEAYNSMMDAAYARLEVALFLKMECMNYCDGRGFENEN